MRRTLLTTFGFIALLIAASSLVTTGSTAQTNGHAEAGKSAFSMCAGCHAVSADAPSPAGPHLEGIVGRKAGSIEGAIYSAGMKTADIVWGPETLDDYLRDPASTVPGTIMYVSVADEASRANIIAYLETLKPGE